MTILFLITLALVQIVRKNINIYAETSLEMNTMSRKINTENTKIYVFWQIFAYIHERGDDQIH